MRLLGSFSKIRPNPRSRLPVQIDLGIMRAAVGSNGLDSTELRVCEAMTKQKQKPVVREHAQSAANSDL